MCDPSKYFSTRTSPTLKPFALACASARVMSPLISIASRSIVPKPRSAAMRM